MEKLCPPLRIQNPMPDAQETSSDITQLANQAVILDDSSSMTAATNPTRTKKLSNWLNHFIKWLGNCTKFKVKP